MAGPAQTRAEDVVRALGAAVAAFRLYPPSSELPAQAVRRACELASQEASASPLRFIVEPKTFRMGDATFGESHAQVSGLAETLYAHQVGQLIIAPGVTESEIVSFITALNEDPATLRERGGLRAALMAAGVSRIAVVELTLRVSTDPEITGIDLVSAPLEVIGPAVVRAVADWARSAAAGEGRDHVSDAIASLESATRELAASRIAEAMSRLDEQTRSAVMAAALRRDPSGQDMSGMLSVIANMKPAALARLLTLTASRTGADAMSLMGRLELPPEAARALMLMLRPNPRSERDSGVPEIADPAAMADEATTADEAEEQAVAEQVAEAARGFAAGRALGTAVALQRRSPSADGLAAIGDALGPALSEGAFVQVKTALDVLQAAAGDPANEFPARRAMLSLTDPETLAAAAARIATPFIAQSAAPVFAVGGAPGADALFTAWARAQGQARQALEMTLVADAEQVLPVAGRRLRSGEPGEAIELARMLGRLQDRRTVAVIAQGLDSASPEVRDAALETLAAARSEQAMRVVASALHHPDERTARSALHQIRLAGAVSATPDLVAALTSVMPPRSWEFKREVVDCLKELRATEAVPALKREAGHIFAFSAKRRMLRQAARDALEAIRSDPEGASRHTGGTT